MQTKIFLTFLFVISYSFQLVAQSDYRITQEFKSKLRAFDIAIEYAKTSDELNNIKKEILDFKAEYKDKKELLDNALYPKNFETSFKDILTKIEFTNKKLSKIITLSERISSVESENKSLVKSLEKQNIELNTLRNNNTKLLNKLRAFRAGYGGNKAELDSLRKLVKELKSEIAKRDTLISEMISNIFADVSHKIETLNDAEKRSIKTKVKNTDLIENIATLIKDNKEFINASLFNKDDLLQLRGEYDDFNKQWSFFGPKLFNIYSSDTVNRVKLFDIDALLFEWDSSINEAIWKSIHNGFKERGEEIDFFANANEFEKNMITYIENEIDSGSKAKYEYFKDKVWDDYFKKEWLPILQVQDLLSREQLNNIENKIDDWESDANSYVSIFLYIIILIFVVAILFIIIRIVNNKDDREESLEDEIATLEKTENKDKKEFEIGEDEEFIDDDKNEKE